MRRTCCSSRVFRPFLHLHLKMASTGRAVYLEDIDGPSKITADAVQKAPDVAESGATVALKVETKVTVAEEKAAKPTTVKRQRTLMDMFSDPAPSTGPAAKKIKLAGSGTTASAGTALTSQAALNSIPFSLSAFQEQLSDEERKLLALECETMGKSWCAACHIVSPDRTDDACRSVAGSRCSKTKCVRPISSN